MNPAFEMEWAQRVIETHQERFEGDQLHMNDVVFKASLSHPDTAQHQSVIAGMTHTLSQTQRQTHTHTQKHKPIRFNTQTLIMDR